jgi:hypothetical protein
MSLVKRRDLLRTVGAATALSFLPGQAEQVWARVLSGYRPPNGLSSEQRSLVSAIADAIIPRTDTPGATDVGVPDWVDLIVAEYMSDAERSAFLSGLQAIETIARNTRGVTFAELAPEARDDMMVLLDRPADRQTPDARAYARLKQLVVHGYFTSERVQKEVLKTEVMPGRFEGNALMPPRRTS